MEIVVQDERFALFDELAEKVSWTLECVQLRASEGNFELFQIKSPDIQLARVKLAAPFVQRGTAVNGYRTFGLMAPGSAEVSWCNRRITQTSIVVFPLSGQYQSVSQPGLHVYTISVSEQLLQRVAREYFQCAPEVLLQDEGQILQCRADQISLIRLLFCQLSERAKPEFGAYCPLACQDIAVNLCQQILRCVEDSAVAKREKCATRRQKALEKSLQLMDSRAPESLSVSLLVEYSGVSQRTLEYAFLDHFSITPHQFLKALKMHKAHRALWKASPGGNGSVAQIARNSGFEHSGQFARDYFAIYGVLPSHTFRRAG